jgi:hypothetical protein
MPSTAGSAFSRRTSASSSSWAASPGRIVAHQHDRQTRLASRRRLERAGRVADLVAQRGGERLSVDHLRRHQIGLRLSSTMMRA